MTASTPSLEGTPFDPVKELGRGGMGVVLEAIDRRSGETCAVKLMLPEVAADPGLVDRVRLEADALLAAASPHFVRCLGTGLTKEGSPYYAMEKLEGTNLWQRIRRNPLPLRELLVFGIQLFDGLSGAHRVGIVHRDIKPENVFLCSGSKPELLKILDFGIAKVVEPVPGGPKPLAVPTAAGVMVGSLRWTAPETIACAGVDARTDIYSAGLVLWAMATGTVPWPNARSMEDLLVAQLQDETPALAPALGKPELAALDRVIAKATTKKKEDRTASAALVATELRKILLESTGEELSKLATGELPRVASQAAAGVSEPVQKPAAKAKAPIQGVTMPTLSPGQQFEGRYEIVDKIGAGGMGVVYGAKQKFLNRQVAIKIIPLEAKAVHAELPRDFHYEMEMLAQIRHPNIVEIHDGGVTSDHMAYIVMERLPGEALRKGLLAHQALSNIRSCAYLGQVAQGLWGIHSIPMIHRDIKPENVMVGPGGVVKIVDFGLARVRTKSKYMTRNPNPVGTLHYMPKEQLLNQEIDESVDIYAFGLMLYELLVGVHPRATESGSFQNQKEAIVSVVQGKPLQTLAERRPDLPSFIHELYERCVHARPEQRPTAKEVVEVFARFSEWIAANPTPDAPWSARSPISKGKRPSDAPPAAKQAPAPNAVTAKPLLPKGGTVPMAHVHLRFADSNELNAGEPSSSTVATDRDLRAAVDAALGVTQDGETEGAVYMTSPIPASVLEAVAKPSFEYKPSEELRAYVRGPARQTPRQEELRSGSVPPTEQEPSPAAVRARPRRLVVGAIVAIILSAFAIAVTAALIAPDAFSPRGSLVKGAPFRGARIAAPERQQSAPASTAPAPVPSTSAVATTVASGKTAAVPVVPMPVLPIATASSAPPTPVTTVPVPTPTPSAGSTWAPAWRKE